MTVKNAIENNCKLFVARQNPSRLSRKPKEFLLRKQEWANLFKELGMECVFTADPRINDATPNKALYMTFQNGLRIEDSDTLGVSFWANEGKEKLDENMANVVQVIRVAAKYLKSRKDHVVDEVFGKKYALHGDNYPGSKPYVDAFVAAYAEKDPSLRTPNRQFDR